MTADIFKGMVGVYAPNLIRKTLAENEHEVEGTLTKRYYFNDGSMVETYGFTIVGYNGTTDSEEDEQPDPADAWFASFYPL